MVYSKTPKSRGFPEHRSPRLSQSQKRFLTTFPNRNPTETGAVFYSKDPKSRGFPEHSHSHTLSHTATVHTDSLL